MSSSYQYLDPLMDCHAATRLRHQKVGPLVGCTNQVARCIGSSRVFQLLQCGACFFGFRLGSAISVTFWLELAKERTRKNPSHPPYCVRDMGEDNWPSEPWYVQAGLLWLSRCARRGSWIQHQPHWPPGHVRKGSRV